MAPRFGDPGHGPAVNCGTRARATPSPKAWLTLVILSLALRGQQAEGQAQLIELRAEDAAAGDLFGWSVSVSSDGTRVAVGAYSSGSAYVFNGATGAQMLKLTAGAAWTSFGQSVAVSSDGTRLVVGATGDDDAGFSSGSAYVFDGTTGAQLIKLMAADATAFDRFGWSVSVSSDGSRVAIGATGDGDAGSNSGSVYVFNGATGAQMLKLAAEDGAADGRFGWSVSVSSDGTRVAVGATGDGHAGTRSGSAYVFDGATGEQLLKLTAEDGEARDDFGRSVSVSSDGSRVAVGATGDGDAGSNSGSVYVFNGATGAQLIKLTAEDGAASDLFGWSVSVSSDGTRVAVGAYQDVDAGSSSGSAYVFDGATGAQLIKLTAEDGAAGVGISVSLTSDGTQMVVGAYKDDEQFSDSGSSYMFLSGPTPAPAPEEETGAAASTTTSTTAAQDAESEEQDGLFNNPFVLFGFGCIAICILSLSCIPLYCTSILRQPRRAPPPARPTVLGAAGAGTDEVAEEAPTASEAAVDEVAYPEWWQRVPAEDDRRHLLPASMGQIEAVQALIDRTWKDVTTRDRKSAFRTYTRPPRMKVLQVQQNHNPRLWRKYVLARERVRRLIKEEDKQCPFTWEVQKQDAQLFGCLGDVDHSINEFMLFHGTRPTACASICENDFMVSMAGSGAGTMYGKGIYFGENSSKSDEYAREEEDGIYSGLCAMLLCRVTCGRMYYTDEVSPNRDSIYTACTGKDRTHHSVLGDRVKARGTYREFVLFENDLAYPEYVVIYRREEA